jgi:hypothetical protein
LAARVKFSTLRQDIMTNDEGPRVFRLDPRAHAALMRRRMIVMIAVVLAAMAGSHLYYQSLSQQQDRPAPLPGEVWVAMAIGLAGLVVFSMVRAVRRAVNSYRLRLEPDALSIEMAGLLPQRVTRAEVTLVRERAGGLEIFRARGLPVGIARSLEGYAEVRAALLTWSPDSPDRATTRRPVIWTAASLAGVIGIFGLGPLSYVVKTQALSYGLAIVSAAAGVWTWWALREFPMKHRAVARGYALFCAAAVLIFNLLRWNTPTR